MPGTKSKVRARRTNRRTRKAATVEGLHASFEKIDGRVRELIKKGKTDSDLACCIRKAWTEQFHMELSVPAVKGMIKHYRAVHPNSRKTRKQRGGMAPLDWTMGQGAHAYGRFPVEIGTTPLAVKALDLGRFYENRGSRAWDTTGGHPAPGQLGGGLFDALTMPHMPASVPRNFLETSVSTLQGARIADPASNPVASSVQLASTAPKAYDAGAISSISSLTPIYKAA